MLRSFGRWRLVAAAAVGVGAYADGNTVFYACYNSFSRSLSNVALGSPVDCSPRLTPVSWSQSGPTGPQGPTGATGPTGPTGAAGAAHAFGSSGIEPGVLLAFFQPGSHNLTGVERQNTGSYCVEIDPSVDLSTTVPVVTIVGTANDQYAMVNVLSQACGLGGSVDTSHGVQVTTKDAAGNFVDPAGFAIVLP